MLERQGCRSASIQGETGDVGETRFCGLRARRMDGCANTGGCTSRARSASSLMTADDCLFVGRLGVLSLPEIRHATEGE
jgi:hypothetical protein